MSDPLGHLMERNLIEVFGQRDSERRKVAISELYTEDCTFFETEEHIVGRDALSKKVEQFGPNGAAPVVTGMDVAVFERGRIRALYTFLDNVPSYENPKGQNRAKHTGETTAADVGQVRK